MISKVHNYTKQKPKHFLSIISCLNDTENNSRQRAHSNPQQNRRTSSHLIYNANRYSPKTATHGPTASSTLSTESNQNLAKRKKLFLYARKYNSNNL